MYDIEAELEKEDECVFLPDGNHQQQLSALAPQTVLSLFIGSAGRGPVFSWERSCSIFRIFQGLWHGAFAEVVSESKNGRPVGMIAS